MRASIWITYCWETNGYKISMVKYNKYLFFMHLQVGQRLTDIDQGALLQVADLAEKFFGGLNSGIFYKYALF